MSTDVETSVQPSLSSQEIADHLRTFTSRRQLVADAAGGNLPSANSSLRSCCMPVIRALHFTYACPMSLSHLYRTIVLFSLPTQYEARIQTLDESSEALASLTSGAAFVSEWFTAGGLCTILLPLSGSMLQVQRVTDSSLSTILVLMALLCAMEGLLVSAVCYAHFSAVKCEEHARAWLRHARQSIATSGWWNIAVVLSLSTSNLVWSIIFFLLALITMYACPQVVCSMINRALERATDVGSSLALWMLVAFRTFYVLYHIRRLRLLHASSNACASQTDLELGTNSLL